MAEVKLYCYYGYAHIFSSRARSKRAIRKFIIVAEDRNAADEKLRKYGQSQSKWKPVDEDGIPCPWEAAHVELWRRGAWENIILR